MLRRVALVVLVALVLCRTQDVRASPTSVNACALSAGVADSGNRDFACIALTAPITTSASVTNLGPPEPVQSPQEAFPLGFFHRVGGIPKASRPTLVFLATECGQTSAMERWPVVKALDQFGTLGHVRSLAGRSTVSPSTTRCAGGSCSTFQGHQSCVVPPTFDWSHATYVSRYIAFDQRDLVDAAGRLRQKMTVQEQALYLRYSYPAAIKLPYTQLAGCHGGHPLSCLVFADNYNLMPLVIIGGYLQFGSRLLNRGDFQVPMPATPPTPSPGPMTLSFDNVRSALLSNNEPSSNSTIALDVNAEANVITALICHADNERPSSVCNRPTIRAILGHVR